MTDPLGVTTIDTPIDLTTPWFPTSLSAQGSALSAKMPEASATIEEAAARVARLEHPVTVMTGRG
jgi:hypothetical protein